MYLRHTRRYSSHTSRRTRGTHSSPRHYPQHAPNAREVSTYTNVIHHASWGLGCTVGLPLEALYRKEGRGTFAVSPKAPPKAFLQFLQWHRLVRASSLSASRR